MTCTVTPTPDEPHVRGSAWGLDVLGVRPFRWRDTPYHRRVSRALAVIAPAGSWLIVNPQGHVVAWQEGRTDTDAMRRYMGSGTASLWAHVEGWTARAAGGEV